MSLEVDIRPSTKDDMHLPAFDNTKMVAFNTCPTWGVLRYGHHKAMPGSGRALALEAGAASHEAFAAIRMLDLYEYGIPWYVSRGFDADRLRNRVDTHMASILTDERLVQFRNIKDSSEDFRRRAMGIAIHVLETSGYYDDPRDKRRTLSNIEEALIAYIDKYPFNHYLPYVSEDMSFIGVEIPFDLTITLTRGTIVSQFRFIGRIDGVSVGKEDNLLRVDENKTASRLDDAWHASFIMSHQVTGYCVAVSTLIKQPVWEGVIHGLSIPLPKTYDYGGVVRHPVKRYPHQIGEWAAWMEYTVQDFLRWVDDPVNAPKFTHSCNRYFRPCSFIPFCAIPPDERQQVYDEMVTDEWSPLHKGTE